MSSKGIFLALISLLIGAFYINAVLTLHFHLDSILWDRLVQSSCWALLGALPWKSSVFFFRIFKLIKVQCKNLWSAPFKTLWLDLEQNTSILEDNTTDIYLLWGRVQFYATLWVFTTKEFRNFPFWSIVYKLEIFCLIFIFGFWNLWFRFLTNALFWIATLEKWFQKHHF